MLKVVIADDEPIIRNGIAKIIPWEKYGCQVAGIARNGEEALKYVEESKADIIISDVKMPKMSGLELLQTIHRADPKVVFIIVSGYDEFRYVQEALNYGAFGYLLKPIVPEEFEEMLLRAVQKVECSDPKETVLDNSQRSIVVETHPLNWLPEYLDGTLKEEDKEFLQNDIIKEKQRWHGMLLIHGLDEGDGRNRAEPERVLQAVEEILLDCGLKSVLFMRKNRLIYVVFSDEKKEVLEEQIQLFCRNWKVKNPKLQYALAISENTVGLQPLGSMQQQVQKIARFQLYTDTKKMTEAEFDHMLQRWQKKFATDPDIFMDLVLAGEKNRLDKCMKQIIMGRSAEEHKEFFEILLFLCYEALILPEQQRSDYRPLSLSEKGRKLRLQKKVQDFLKLMDMELGEVFKRLDYLCSKSTQMVVERAKAMARLDYRDSSLSLSVIAQRLGFNPAYFSHTFSSVAQQGFAEFLTDLRMEKAKALLLTDMKIQHIAESVGYSNQPYFSTRFRAQTGLTPSQYREKYCNYLEQ